MDEDNNDLSFNTTFSEPEWDDVNTDKTVNTPLDLLKKAKKKRSS